MRGDEPSSPAAVATTNLRRRAGKRPGNQRETRWHAACSTHVGEVRTMSLASCWAARVALMAVGTALTVGCSHATESASVGFALPSTTAALVGAKPLETRAVRVLATRVDLRQPVFVMRAGEAIEVTYAVRQRDGVTVRLDARTLRQIGEPTPYLYPRC